MQVSHKSYRYHKLGRTFLHNDPYLIYHNIAVWLMQSTWKLLCTNNNVVCFQYMYRIWNEN